MFTTQRPQLNEGIRRVTRRQRRPFQRGQSIVVALLVLLLLGLAGALFVTIVARNIINAGKANRVQTADQYAAAGITYSDSQLSNSVDGADWRPALQFAVSDGTNGTVDNRPGTGPAGPAPYGAMVLMGDSRERKRYKSQVYDPVNNPNGSLKQVPLTDPDAEYLLAGYARYNTGAGRYLVRVTYNPVNLVGDPNNTANNYVSTTGLAVPPGKYLKVESIGREGNIDQTDPTTYNNNRSNDKTQATLVAYKPIGITDYARFETNPDKRSDIANLGVVSQFYAANTDGGIGTPGVSDFNQQGSTSANGTTPPTIQEYPVITTYGAADAYLKATAAPNNLYPNANAGSGQATPPTNFTYVMGGGSIHSNMSLRFFGTNVMYLNPTAASSPLFQDTAEIGGDLLLDSYNDANPLYTTSSTATAGQQAALILNPTSLSNPTTGVSATQPNNASTSAYVAPSNSTTQTNGSFDTHGGLIRDGSMQNDPEGLPRSITRLEPPLVDAQDNASQMPRYRAIAMNSAPRTYTNASGTTATYAPGSAQYGYGKAIYVNNPNDIQQDSASIGGGSTLTDEWLHRTAANSTGTNKGGWNGLFYNPPGVTIVLGQQLTPPANANTAGTYGIRLTRTDQFANPDGTPNGGATMDVSYADLGAEATNANLNLGTSPDNNIVIYAEGNVRVRGILSPDEGTPTNQMTLPRQAATIPRHITIVTGGTAYIEGNLLKGDPDSTITVLAHDYVCVNTTQFLAGSNVENRTNGIQNPDLPDSGDALILDASHSLLQGFNFGLTGSATPAGYPSPLALYIAAGPAGGGSTTADIDILGPTGINVPPAPLMSELQQSPLIQSFTTLTHTTFDLSSLAATPTTSNYFLNGIGLDQFQLSVSKDPGTENGANTSQDVALERVAVLPMDIRIEAVLYAQTGSFFVIPGDWFNTNSNDNLSTFLDTFTPMNSNNTPISPDGTRPDVSGAAPGSPAFISGSRFPMYGQPIDLKITIDGSVSEAHPADIAAQTAWMLHWGWIPQYHGSLVVSSSPSGGGASMATETAGHTLAGQPAIGLQIIYDPQAGYPYHPPLMASDPAYYLRSDAYGRPLPFTPMLPVSTGLLYSGQSGEAPLLQ